MMAYVAMKSRKQLGAKELQENIYITLASKNVKNLEKGNSPPQLCLFLLFCYKLLCVLSLAFFFFINKN